MSNVDSVRQKVQRILTQNMGPVRVDEDGDFIVQHESARMLIEVCEGFGEDGVIVQFNCPLVRGVKLTNEVYKWVATKGQSRRIGALRVVEFEKTPGVGVIANEQCIIADDLDESELMANVAILLSDSAELDTQLQSMFGGELFGED
jgi:hypothetical protein